MDAVITLAHPLKAAAGRAQLKVVPSALRGRALVWRQFRRNRGAMLGLVIALAFVVVALVGPSTVPYGPYSQALLRRLEPPSIEHWMGTDELGRDILARVVVGAQFTLLISLAATVLATVTGTLLGAAAGYYGKVLGQVIMRFMDILLAIPGILLALTVIAVLGANLLNAIIAIGVHSIPAFARLAHGSALSVRETEYVLAARAVGAPDRTILRRHVLPNILAPILVQFSLRIATAVLTAAGLSFLGLGAQPPTPEWGAMLSQARTYMPIAPHIALFPGLAIFLTVLGFNLLGDGARDALDPRLRS